MWRNLESKLVGLLVVILAISLAMTLSMFLEARSESDNAKRLKVVNLLTSRLYSASALQALERGVGSILIGSHAPSKSLKARLLELGQDGDIEVTKALARAEEIASITNNRSAIQKQIEIWKQSHMALAGARLKVLSGEMPLDQWLKITTENINNEFRLRTIVFAPKGAKEAATLYNSVIQVDAATLAEYAGRERALLGAAIAAGQAIGPARLSQLRGYRTIVEEMNEKILSIKNIPNISPLLIKAIENYERVFLDEYQKLREIIYKHSSQYNYEKQLILSQTRLIASNITPILRQKLSPNDELIPDKKTIRMILEVINKQINVATNVYLLNSKGDFLIHPDMDKQWKESPEALETEFTLNSKMPQTSLASLLGEPGSITNASGKTYIYYPVLPDSSGKRMLAVIMLEMKKIDYLIDGDEWIIKATKGIDSALKISKTVGSLSIQATELIQQGANKNIFISILLLVISSIAFMLIIFVFKVSQVTTKELRLHRDHLEDLVKARTAEVEELAYIASHDLKAPLRGISSLAEWIIEDYGHLFDEKGKVWLEKIIDRAIRMNNLITDILQYSSIGKTTLEKVNIDSKKTIERVIDSLSPPENIQVSINGRWPELIYNEIQFTQVFQNLIGNAMDHMGKPDGKVVVSCIDKGNFWEFCVNDSGVGIDPIHFERIFKMFQSLNVDKKANSTGIGLAIVQKIAVSNGGTIRVESSKENGSSFFFTAPKTPITR